MRIGETLRVAFRVVLGACVLVAGLILASAHEGCGGDGAGGSGSCTLSPSNYDQSCQMDSDCIAVFLGDVCADECAGNCPNAAIRASARYNADLSAAQARMSHGGVACSCALGPALCRAGSCAIHSPLDDAGVEDSGGQ